MKIFNFFFDFVDKIVSSYSSNDEFYHKKIPTTTEVAGYRIDDELLGRILVEKYKTKNLPK